MNNSPSTLWVTYGNVMGSGSNEILLYRHASDVLRILFISGRIMWNISATSMATANHWWFIPFYTYDITIEHGFSAARLWLWQGTFSSVADFVLFANLQLNILVLQRTFLSLLALQLLDNLADYVRSDVVGLWASFLFEVVKVRQK
jgi:hypothetical protein